MIRELGEALKDQRGHVRAAARAPIAAAHLRKDAWWALPLTTAVVLLAFIVYSTWAALQNAHYFAPPYLSPFYSPCISKSCVHATFGYGLPDFTFPVIGDPASSGSRATTTGRPTTGRSGWRPLPAPCAT
jgi:hypothetical protein